MKIKSIKKEVEKLLKNPKKLMAKMDKLINPKKLTTPPEIDKNIIRFCTEINSESKPFYVEVKPELWCRQSCCDLNVKKFIENNGGEIVCGYKIWYNKPTYLEAERHAIWSNGSEMRDLTFNSDGEEKVLFIPDVPGKTKELESNIHRIRWSIQIGIRAIIKAYEKIESQIPVEQMSDEESWETMISYEEWLEGKRMSSLIQKTV